MCAQTEEEATGGGTPDSGGTRSSIVASDGDLKGAVDINEIKSCSVKGNVILCRLTGGGQLEIRAADEETSKEWADKIIQKGGLAQPLTEAEVDGYTSATCFNDEEIAFIHRQVQTDDRQDLIGFHSSVKTDFLVRTHYSAFELMLNAREISHHTTNHPAHPPLPPPRQFIGTSNAAGQMQEAGFQLLLGSWAPQLAARLFQHIAGKEGEDGIGFGQLVDGLHLMSSKAPLADRAQVRDPETRGARPPNRPSNRSPDR